MSKQGKDLRPKVINLHQSLDGMKIAAKASILWPCHAFTVTIPKKRNNLLNIFEETILELTNIESGDTDRIAELTCLDKELVSFIQNRLIHLTLIDNRKNLTEEGKKLLESMKDNQNVQPEYVSGTMFVDLHTGQLLPYYHAGSLEYQTVLSIKGDYIKIDIGTTGKPIRKNCILINPNYNSYWEKNPTSNEVIRSVREFKKKFKRYAIMGQKPKQEAPFVPTSEAITIQDNPELIYLHCHVFIQVGNSDLLVTDGCGFGFSDSFARYLTSQGFNWITEFKKRGIIDEIGDGDENSDKQQNTIKVYSEITSRILNIRKDLKKLQTAPTTTAEEEDYIKKRQYLVPNNYAALEWALKYTVVKYPVSEWEEIFKSQNYKDNQKLIHGFATKIGIYVTDKNRSILQLKAGAIRQIEHGKVELQPLLALAITGAAVKHANHPFSAVASKYPNILGIISKIKRLRDPVAHGDISDYKMDSEELNHLSKIITNIVIMLLPSIIPELQREDETLVESSSDVNQDRLKAEIQIEKDFGSIFVLEIGEGIKEQLLRAEIMLNNFTVNKSIEIVVCYASVMQLFLFDKIESMPELNNKEIDLKQLALEKIVEIGFYPSITDIPKEISTVNKKQIERVLRGSSTTLGGHLLAFVLLYSEKELAQFKESAPEFIDVIVNLLRLRKHGNESYNNYSKDNLISLKNQIIKIVKATKENLHEQ